MAKLISHPFPFLLHLEWIILGFVILDACIPRLYFVPINSMVVFIAVALFGLQGLYLPKSNHWFKYPYTLFSLVILVALSGGLPRLFFAPSIVLVMRSCLMFKALGRLTIIVFSFIFLWLRLSARIKDLPLINTTNPAELVPLIRWGFSLLYGMCVVFVLMTVDALVTERRNQESLTLAHEQLREYALRIENQATLEERNRIAREIHDSLGHHLTALNIQLETGLKLWHIDPDRAYSYLVQAKASGSQALQAIRESVSTLRKDSLAGKLLQEAIGELCNSFQTATNIIPQCQIAILPELPNPIPLTIYRIVQEALTNICKHAGINDRSVVVSIKIFVNGGRVKLEIKDNGRGFATDQNRSGFGLQSMEERVKALGGDLVIESALEEGCRIFAQIPLFPPLLSNNPGRISQ